MTTQNQIPTGFDWNPDLVENAQAPIDGWSNRKKATTAGITALVIAAIVSGILAVTHTNQNTPTVGHPVTHVHTTTAPTPTAGKTNTVTGPTGATVTQDSWTPEEVQAFGQPLLNKVSPEVQGLSAGFLGNADIASGVQTPAKAVQGTPLVGPALANATEKPTDLFMDTIRDTKSGVLFAKPLVAYKGTWSMDPSGAKKAGFHTDLVDSGLVDPAHPGQSVLSVNWTADAAWFFTQHGKTGVQAIDLERDYVLYLLPNPDTAGQPWIIYGYQTSAIRFGAPRAATAAEVAAK